MRERKDPSSSVNQEDEMKQEVNLIDAMFYILYRWKKVAVVALILAVLMGGLKVISTTKSNAAIDNSAVNEAYESALVSYREQAAEVQASIDTIEEVIAKQEKYNQESVLMNLDTNAFYEGMLNVYITSETENILSLFQNLLKASNVQDTIATSMGWEVSHLSEVVSVSITSNDSMNTTGMLSVRTDAPTQEEAEQLLALYVEAYEGANTQIRDTVAEYDTKIMNQTVNRASSTTYNSTQAAARETLASYRNTLATYKKNLEALEEPMAPTLVLPVNPVRAGVKSAVIGAVLGVFLMICYFCVAFIASDKIYSADNLRLRKHIRIMGVLADASRKNADPVTKLLRKLEGRQVVMDERKELELLAANVNNYRGGAEVILVAGTADETGILDVAGALKECLSEIQVIPGGNMLTGADTLAKLPLCEGVLLVEACGKSSYKDLNLELEKIQDMNKKLIGCVVIDL